MVSQESTLTRIKTLQAGLAKKNKNIKVDNGFYGQKWNARQIHYIGTLYMTPNPNAKDKSAFLRILS